MTDKHEPQIYVACLAAYNNGHLYGKWITPKADRDELEAQIKEILKFSPVAGAEEWAIHDYDDFPNLGEYPDLDKLIQVQEAIDEHGKHVVNAFLENWSIEDLDHIKDAYYNFSDGVYGLLDMTYEESGFDKDPVVKKTFREAKKLLMNLDSHLDKNYKGWE